MTLTNPMFYVGLAKRCFEEAARSNDSIATVGLRRLGQQYLDEAKKLSQGAQKIAARQERMPDVA